MRVAFIGLGAMGEPMAGHLLKAGHEVTIVGHRRPEPVARLTALGAQTAATPQAAATGCAAVVLMLPSSEEVRRVVLGSDGVAAAMAGGTCLVDCSTSDPAVTREIAAELGARGIAMVDAPVTRGVQGARDGKLAFFVGGDDAIVARIQPLLAAMGDTFLRMGPVGAGHATKIVVQALSYSTVALVSEALLMGAAAGIELPALQQALLAGAGSKALESFGPRIAARQLAPARVVVADAVRHLDVALRMLHDAGLAHPVHAAAAQMLAQVAASGHARSDLAALRETWPASLGEGA